MRNADGHNCHGEPTDFTLAEVAAELRIIDHRSGWSRTLAIGELILKRFFDDDIRNWQTHRSDKESSLRRLALRCDCPLGRSALSEAVAVYVACREMPVRQARDQLSPSHVAAVLKLASSQRVTLLEQAIATHWSVRELRSQVSQVRKHGGERRGRPLASPPSAALTHARNAVLLLRKAVELLRAATEVERDLSHRLQATLAEVEDHLARARSEMVALGSGPRVGLAPALSKARAGHKELNLATG